MWFISNSPWQNGMCERNYYIVDVSVEKMIEDDPSMKLEVPLAWAVNAKTACKITVVSHLFS